MIAMMLVKRVEKEMSGAILCNGQGLLHESIDTCDSIGVQSVECT